MAGLRPELGTAVAPIDSQSQGYGLLKAVLEGVVPLCYTENSQTHT